MCFEMRRGHRAARAPSLGLPLPTFFVSVRYPCTSMYFDMSFAAAVTYRFLSR